MEKRAYRVIKPSSHSSLLSIFLQCFPAWIFGVCFLTLLLWSFEIPFQWIGWKEDAAAISSFASSLENSSDSIFDGFRNSKNYIALIPSGVLIGGYSLFSKGKEVSLLTKILFGVGTFSVFAICNYIFIFPLIFEKFFRDDIIDFFSMHFFFAWVLIPFVVSIAIIWVPKKYFSKYLFVFSCSLACWFFAIVKCLLLEYLTDLNSAVYLPFRFILSSLILDSLIMITLFGYYVSTTKLTTIVKNQLYHT